jgi:hypothetical protein
MIVEMLEGATIAISTLFIGKRALLALKKKPRYDDGILSWSIYQRAPNGNLGFRCPKCINISKNIAQPAICSCFEYHKEHYHFKCNDCGYTNIMRQVR